MQKVFHKLYTKKSSHEREDRGKSYGANGRARTADLRVMSPVL